METTISFMFQGWGFALNPLWYQMLRWILYEVFLCLSFFLLLGGGGGRGGFIALRLLGLGLLTEGFRCLGLLWGLGAQGPGVILGFNV